MMINANAKSKETLCKVGLLVYAVYNTTNRIRNSEAVNGSNAHFDCSSQFFREGAKGHDYSMRVLDGAFC